jgi:hypothetical protein
VGNIDRISIINIFETPQGILWNFFEGNCSQHGKQDLPKKVGVAAHAVILIKTSYLAWVSCAIQPKRTHFFMMQIK